MKFVDIIYSNRTLDHIECNQMIYHDGYVVLYKEDLPVYTIENINEIDSIIAR